jgi:hypothetical protein
MPCPSELERSLLYSVLIAAAPSPSAADSAARPFARAREHALRPIEAKSSRMPPSATLL